MTSVDYELGEQAFMSCYANAEVPSPREKAENAIHHLTDILKSPDLTKDQREGLEAELADAKFDLAEINKEAHDAA